MIYPFWILLIFRTDFILWTAGLLLVLAVLTFVFLFLFPSWIIVALMAAAIVTYGLRWASMFLIRMIVDYDANNGDGRVIIQRLIPHPTLPETVQFPLQQAAEGSPEVNTKGLFNTFVEQVKWLKFLRPLTVGDLTLRGPAAPFGITMHGIQDPGGVRKLIEEEWKKIAKIKAKEKEARDRREQIDRMTIAVSQGITQGFKEIGFIPPNTSPPPQLPPGPPTTPPEPEPMEWIPIGAYRARAAPHGVTAGGAERAKSPPPTSAPEPTPAEEPDSVEEEAAAEAEEPAADVPTPGLGDTSGNGEAGELGDAPASLPPRPPG